MSDVVIFVVLPCFVFGQRVTAACLCADVRMYVCGRLGECCAWGLVSANAKCRCTSFICHCCMWQENAMSAVVLLEQWHILDCIYLNVCMYVCYIVQQMKSNRVLCASVHVTVALVACKHSLVVRSSSQFAMPSSCVNVFNAAVGMKASTFTCTRMHMCMCISELICAIFM